MKISLDEEFKGGIPELLINHLLSMNISFLVSEDQRFVTSDFPVIYDIHDVECGDCAFKALSIPINQYCLLLYSYSPTGKPFRNKLKIISNKQVDRINRSYI